MLPASRNTTYTPGSPVLSADLNALQDMVVGNKSPSFTDWHAPSTPNSLGSGNSMANGGIALGTTGEFVGMPLGPIREGTRITAFSVRLLGGAIGKTVSFNLVAGTGGTLLGTLAITTTSASFATYTLTLGTPYVITPGDALSLNQSALSNQSGMEVGPVGITSDRL